MTSGDILKLTSLLAETLEGAPSYPKGSVKWEIEAQQREILEGAIKRKLPVNFFGGD
jgi:hypothetical protein